MDFFDYFSRIADNGDKKLGRKNFPAELFGMLFLVSVVIQRIP
ncbi:hypothetical protein SDC9_84658 [bioreactor metagenome]|uniref:Uncharacterized protein n=1 Tax=bioreactor metagenome TaxID=1076179 RepID=A0A644ZAV5_9ZZZZ